MPNEDQVPGGIWPHPKDEYRRSTRQDGQMNYLSTLSIFMKQTTYLATLPNPNLPANECHHSSAERRKYLRGNAVISESNAEHRHPAPRPESEIAMTILARLDLWKDQGAISTEQRAHLVSLSRREPLSLSLELNLLLYAGVVAFVAGLGWTISTWSQQLGDVLVLTILSILLTASFS